MFTSQGEYDRFTKRLMAYYAEKAGVVDPRPTESQDPAKETVSSANYVVNVYSTSQGLVIGDEALVKQRFIESDHQKNE